MLRFQISSARSVDEKHLMRFQSVNVVFKVSPAYNVVCTGPKLVSKTVPYFAIVCLFIYSIYIVSEWLN